MYLTPCCARRSSCPGVLFLSGLSPFPFDPAPRRYLTPGREDERGHPRRGDPCLSGEELVGRLPEDLEVVVRELDRLQEAFVAEVAEALEDVVPVGALVEAGGLEDIIEPEEAVSATGGGEDRLVHTGLDGLDRLLLGGSLLTTLGLLGEGEGTVLQLEETTGGELEDLHRGEVLDGGVEGSEDRGGEGLGHVGLQLYLFVTLGILSPW